MIYPRCLARLLAWLGGYFWTPCPRCGRMFAGFEAGWYSWNPGPWKIEHGFRHRKSKLVCQRCDDELRHELP